MTDTTEVFEVEVEDDAEFVPTRLPRLSDLIAVAKPKVEALAAEHNLTTEEALYAAWGASGVLYNEIADQLGVPAILFLIRAANVTSQLVYEYVVERDGEANDDSTPAA